MCSWRCYVIRDIVLCQNLSWCSGLHRRSYISCWQNRRWCLCVTVFIIKWYTVTHIANFSVCHAYYKISVVKVLLSNNCTVIIIAVNRPLDKSKIPEFTIKLNEILSSTSQSGNVFIVGDLNINLLDPIAIENDFINNCHSNSLPHSEC